MLELPIIVVAFALLAMGAGNAFFGTEEAERMLLDWSRTLGVQIEEKERQWILFGPFAWRATNQQRVFRFTALTASGDRKTGWARCGHPLLGLFVFRVTVEWEQT